MGIGRDDRVRGLGRTTLVVLTLVQIVLLQADGSRAHMKGSQTYLKIGSGKNIRTSSLVCSPSYSPHSVSLSLGYS